MKPLPRRVWPFGTRKPVEVVRAAMLQRGGKSVPFLVLAERTPEKEGHVLIDGGGEGAQKGDLGTITFTHGGPTGGYWKFTQDQPQPAEKP